jgi:hypothetical protein
MMGSAGHNSRTLIESWRERTARRLRIQDMRTKLIATVAIVAFLVPFAVQADDWKDESGKGRGYRIGPSQNYYGDDRKRDRDGYGGDRGYYYQPRIPDGHLPPPGECRVWYPDRPAGHQPPPVRC